jgi:hypothetical protein
MFHEGRENDTEEYKDIQEDKKRHDPLKQFPNTRISHCSPIEGHEGTSQYSVLVSVSLSFA